MDAPCDLCSDHRQNKYSVIYHKNTDSLPLKKEFHKMTSYICIANTLCRNSQHQSR